MGGLRGAVEAVLVLGIVGLLAIHLLIDDDKTKRGTEFLPNMVMSPAYAGQDPNPNFPDGKNLQVPPPGTIARGFLPDRADGVLLDTDTPWKDLSAGGKAAWAALESPWAGRTLEGVERARLLARGAAVFRSTCATCHGPLGVGPSEVTKRGVPLPPSLIDQQAKDYADGHIYRFISHGIGNMPSHASQIERRDRWKVILHLRSLQAP